jgi:hypothetical protein
VPGTGTYSYCQGEYRGQATCFNTLNDSQTTTDAYTFEAFGNPMSQSGTMVNLAKPCPPRGGQGRHGGAVSPGLATFRYVGALDYYRHSATLRGRLRPALKGRDRTSALRLLGARYYGPSERRFWRGMPPAAAA